MNGNLLLFIYSYPNSNRKRSNMAISACFICEGVIQPSKMYGQLTLKKSKGPLVYQYCGHHSGVELKKSIIAFEAKENLIAE